MVFDRNQKRPYGSVLEYSKKSHNVRRNRSSDSCRVKLRGRVGVVGSKHFLKISMLNVDGLTPSTLEDVKSTLLRKGSDVCVLLETKRPHEEVGSDISIDGYAVHEVRRSDVAGDRLGGGLAYYTPSRLTEFSSKIFRLPFRTLIFIM